MGADDKVNQFMLERSEKASEKRYLSKRNEHKWSNYREEGMCEVWIHRNVNGASHFHRSVELILGSSLISSQKANPK